MMTCQVATCSKKAIGGRFCALHYSKAVQFGDMALRHVSDKPVRVEPIKPKPTPAKPKPVPRERTPKPKCHYLGCEKVAFGEQLCRQHFHLVYPEVKRPQCTSKSTCSIDGCERPAQARQLCTMHWARWSRHGDPLIKSNPGPKPKPKPSGTQQSRSGTCSEPGCDASIKAKRLCSVHYELHAASDQTKPRCGEGSCDRPIRKRGLCASHYELDRRAKLDADPTAPRCLEPDCNSAAVTAGRCRPCYRRNLGR